MGISHDLKTPLSSIEGYIETLADGMAEDFRPEALHSRREFTYVCALSDEWQIPMDTSLIYRVMENMLNNALKYTKEGDTITLRAGERGGFITIELSDTGQGISEENLPFFRESASTGNQASV